MNVLEFVKLILRQMFESWLHQGRCMSQWESDEWVLLACILALIVLIFILLQEVTPWT